MQLGGQQIAKIHNVLLDAFRSRGDLERMLRFHLDMQLNAIAGGENLSDVMFNLITWAESQDKINELLTGALESNPNNKALRTLVESFTADEFVITARSREWELLKEQIELRLQSQLNNGCIINMIGAAGIGKTTLLKDIFPKRLHTAYPNVAWSLVNLDIDSGGQQYLHPVEGPLKILEDWMANLAHQSYIPTLEFRKTIDELATLVHKTRKEGFKNQKLTQLEPLYHEAAQPFINLLKRYNKTPLVLLLDTVEHAPQELISWLEQAILIPVVNLGGIIVVLASRRPVRWQRSDFRRQVIIHALKAFDREQIVNLMPPLYSQCAPAIINMSFGLPAAVDVLLSGLRGIEEIEQGVLYEEILQLHLNRLVREYLLENLFYKNILKHLSTGIRETLFIISPLRYFRIDVIARFLPIILPSYANMTGGTQIFGVLEELLATNLVEWNREKSGYIIQEPLRKIMALILMIEEPRRFLLIHSQVADIYADRLELNSQSYREEYMIEWLFHKAHLLNGAGRQDGFHQLPSTLDLWMNSYRKQEEWNLSAIDTLYNQLESDEELREALDKIEQGAFSAILNTVGRYRTYSTQIH